MMALPLDLPLESNEFSFSEKRFLPFTESNQIFVIHKSNNKIDDKDTASAAHTCLINAYGRLLFVEENKVVCLPKLLNELSLKSGHSIELSCGDVLPSEDDEALAFLATFWVELNEHFCPCRHFGALFRISTTLHVELTCKAVASAPVAYCSLIKNMKNLSNQLYWIVYEAEKALCVYKVQEDCRRIEKVAHTLSVFPELALDGFPGAVIRSSLACSGSLRWSALGFDTGHVFLSVYAIDTHIVYRKLIKFSGPISVVCFLSHRVLNTPTLPDEENSPSSSLREERYLVVSSALGPVAVWKCCFDGDVLYWNHEFVLKQSEQFDAITSASVVGDLIAVATYSGKILFYSSNCDLLSHEITSITQIHAPLVTVKLYNETTLYALSTAGLHTIKRSDT